MDVGLNFVTNLLFSFRVILILIFFVSGCSVRKEYRDQYWVYLSGLTDSPNSVLERYNRSVLKQISDSLSIKIIALIPDARCPIYQNLLCWPHETEDLVTETYKKILLTHCMENIAGFIGFSNGAFFLNRLFQLHAIDKPIISIGGGGFFSKSHSQKTALTLIIGRQDKAHYSNVLTFARSAQGHMNVRLIIHDGGHEIPAYLLQKELQMLLEH